MHIYCKTLSLVLLVWAPVALAAGDKPFMQRFGEQAPHALLGDPLLSVYLISAGLKKAQELLRTLDGDLYGQSFPAVCTVLQEAGEKVPIMWNRLTNGQNIIPPLGMLRAEGPTLARQIVVEAFPEASRSEWQQAAAVALLGQNPFDCHALVSATGKFDPAQRNVSVVIKTLIFNPLVRTWERGELFSEFCQQDSIFPVGSGNPEDIVADAWQQKLVKPLSDHYASDGVKRLLPDNLVPLLDVFRDRRVAASFLGDVLQSSGSVVELNAVIPLGEKRDDEQAADPIAAKLALLRMQ